MSEPEVPPQRIWIDRSSLKAAKTDGAGDYYFEPYKPLPQSSIPYVPASALAEVWEKAIAIAGGVAISDNYDPAIQNGFTMAMNLIQHALEVVRDAALKHKQKENEDAQRV